MKLIEKKRRVRKIVEIREVERVVPVPFAGYGSALMAPLLRSVKIETYRLKLDDGDTVEVSRSSELGREISELGERALGKDLEETAELLFGRILMNKSYRLLE